MKTITKQLILFITILFITKNYSQSFQNTYQVSNKHYHDLNIEPINDGTNDIIVAGNLFDAPMANEIFTLKRVDNLGNLVWSKTYNNSTFQHARCFDIVNYFDLMIITGAVDISGSKSTFIAIIEAATGNVNDVKFYDIVSPNFNSTGLNIKVTQSDADGDGLSDLGFVVSGFFSSCYAIDENCSTNIGFVLRTDFNLNKLWTIEIDTPSAGSVQDYDFANNVTETSTGFFITGSATAPIASGFNRQAVLAHKVDFQGNFMWDNSYVFGNSRDVSVDAYYDTTSQKIFMLTNYSVSHNFGVTTIDDSAGVIIFSQSWYANGGSDFNDYGFKLIESETSNNLIVTGYDRDENWIDGLGNSRYGESNLFVYEFEKLTGNPVAVNYQYLASHVEPTGDEYNFWNAQMPLIYYPDISFTENTATPSNYHHIGYRTDVVGAYTGSELFKTANDKKNDCERKDFIKVPSPITITALQVISGSTPCTASPFVLDDFFISNNVANCDGTSLSIIDDSIAKVISVYPNPTKTSINFSTENIKLCEIYDVLGRIVLTKEMNTKSIMVNGLNKGMYIIKLYGVNNTVYTSKFIKN